MKRTRLIGWGLALALLAALAVTSAALAAQPRGPAAAPETLRGNLAPAAAPLGTAFTYQGVLKQSGNPVNGACDLQFSLYDASTGGAQVGATQTQSAVSVANGLLTTSLDFGGSAFTGDSRWLNISVRCPAGSGNYTALSPRQELAAAPYSLASKGLALPFASNLSSGGDAFSITNTGTGGAGYFEIQNATNSNPVLYALTNGTGPAGLFQIGNVNSSSAALLGQTNGTGSAGVFRIDNMSSSATALRAETNSSGAAVFGSTTGNGAAVSGVSSGTGAAGIFLISNGSNGNPALWAWTSGNGYVGRFDGTGGASQGVIITVPAGKPGLVVVGGTKSAVVATSRGDRALYTEESTGVWFTDYGFGRLQGGVALVPIDPLFAETVSLGEPYHVFLQAYGDAELYVSQRTPTGFEVKLRGGDASVEFSYRLVAKRKGYEQTRLEQAPAAPSAVAP
ncbi:MAG: hypothetical protein HY686_04200 [Chloroflexi bacterium]|nr:hypothetical protein [Chloroflexota bacterium]